MLFKFCSTLPKTSLCIPSFFNKSKVFFKELHEETSKVSETGFDIVGAKSFILIKKLLI